MSYETPDRFREEFGPIAAQPLRAYWLALLRVVTGWWFFHAGVTKLLESGLSFGSASAYLSGMEGTALGPLPVWMGNNLGWALGALVPLGETLIGLGLMVGALVRLAAFFGAVFMTFFWVGNAAFAHGIVSSDLMGLLLFGTVMVLAAGRYFGLDAIIERTRLVKEHPRLRYLLG